MAIEMQRQHCVVLCEYDCSVAHILADRSSDMTAHPGEMGCYTKVDTAIELVLPVETVTVQDVTLAIHGVYVAWKDAEMASTQPAVTTTTTLPSSTSLSTQIKAQETSSSSSDRVSKTKSPAITTEDDVAHAKEIAVHESRSTTASSLESVASPTHDRQPKPILSTPTVAASVPTTPASTKVQQAQAMPSGVIAGIAVGGLVGACAIVGFFTLAAVTCRRQAKRYAAVSVQVFDTPSDFQDGKQRWSYFSLVVGSSDNGNSNVVSEADSRAVSGTVAELEGD